MKEDRFYEKIACKICDNSVAILLIHDDVMSCILDQHNPAAWHNRRILRHMVCGMDDFLGYGISNRVGGAPFGQKIPQLHC